MADRSAEQMERVGKLLARGLPVFFVAAAVVTAFAYDFGTAILVLAFGVLLGVITILWASVRTLSGDAPITIEEALALSAPTEAEEQKRAVLSALKDLEYERSVGKIAETDYQELLHRYRAEAKRLLRSMDEESKPMRDRAEAYVAKELGKPAGEQKPSHTPSDTKSNACPDCQTVNDADALFCKKCATRLSAPAREKRNATV
jgi:hypothetical protein